MKKHPGPDVGVSEASKKSSEVTSYPKLSSFIRRIAATFEVFLGIMALNSAVIARVLGRLIARGFGR